ncbi:DUF6711 family protein [Enterococcus sp.]|uniref:DUF6711 family protein n=1 Tax=Enterococcus sp. TaxID=35783 RepID=UPI0028A1282D|nr:hypothetical protein [Enterococcus sp.]
MLVINNVTMPAPNAYEVSEADVDSENTTRSESGVLHRDRIRGGIRKIQVTWRVKESSARQILAAVSPAAVSVTYLDTQTGGNRNSRMYAGDRKMTLVQHRNTLADPLWDVSFSLTEY